MSDTHPEGPEGEEVIPADLAQDIMALFTLRLHREIDLSPRILEEMNIPSELRPVMEEVLRKLQENIRTGITELAKTRPRGRPRRRGDHG